MFMMLKLSRIIINIAIIAIMNAKLSESNIIEKLPSGNRGNWDYKFWIQEEEKIKSTKCIKDKDFDMKITTKPWPIKKANRVILTVETTSLFYCAKSNISDWADCQIRLSVDKTSKDGTSVSMHNVTSFPSDTFFNSSKNTTRIKSYPIDNVTDFGDLVFTFESKRFCGYINKISLAYYECPFVTTALVGFNKTAAPDALGNITKVPGTCIKHATLENPDQVPYMNCKYDGSYKINGKCVCDAGYSVSTSRKSCTACEAGFYKPARGNDNCGKCGKNSKDGQAPRETCSCKDGFFKFLEKINDVEADCYAPPGKPTDINLSNTTADQVTVTWTASENGSDPQGIYILQCSNCPSAYGVNVNTSLTRIDLTGLSAYVNYSMVITKKNTITEKTGKQNSHTFKFQTAEGAPTLIQDPTYETLSDGSVQFKWKPPFGRGGKDIVYVVSYGDKNLRIKTTTFSIKTDTQDREYFVQIFVETFIKNKLVRGPIYSAKVKVNGGIPLGIALAVAFGVVIFVVVALVAAFCFWKKRNPAYLQVVRMPDGTVKLPTRFYSGDKVYVDPKTYPDVDDAVNEFAFEIAQDELRLGEKIGDGEFAEVFKGILFRNGKDHQVAVKMLRATATQTDRSDFLSEAAILGQFSDRNVIFLQGVILKERPNAIILEFMVNGSLDKYLQVHDMQFTIVELLEMGRGIASGMKYLSELGFIHRDLAARNILVDENRVCKIADFGMSLEIKMDDTVESLSGKVPVRWTAPEAIQFKKFTTASDVWSYGIVLWEIMSYGERPYWDWTNYEVLEKVSSGYRLPPPMSCPGVVHDLLLQCWTKDRTRRPLFSIIRTRLESWIKHPELLEGSTVIELDDNLDYTIMQTINKWLEAISMGRYTKNFIEQGFATPRQILLLTNDDLERLGIGALEHRKRILRAISNTRTQVEDSMIRTSSDVVGNPNAA